MSFFCHVGAAEERPALLIASVRCGPLRLGAPRTGGRPARIWYRAVRRATLATLRLRVLRRRRRRGVAVVKVILICRPLLRPAIAGTH